MPRANWTTSITKAAKLVRRRPLIRLAVSRPALTGTVVPVRTFKTLPEVVVVWGWCPDARRDGVSGSSLCASPLLAVEVEGEWREHQGDGCGRDEGPGDRAAGAAGVVHQVPGRVSDVADGVDVHEGLEPAGHGARLDEDVAGERGRYQQGEAETHDGGRVADEQGGRSPQPGQGEPECDDKGHAGDHARGAAVGPVADDDAEAYHDGGGEQVAAGVAEQAAEHERAAPDGQGAEAVEHACGHVLGEAGAAVHGDSGDAHNQRAGQEGREVVAGRAADGAAEDVGEQDGEHDRDGDYVRELLGFVLDLEHGPPPEGGRGGERSGTAGRPAGGEQAVEAVSLRHGRADCGDGGAHEFVSWWSTAAGLAGWPVRARNASCG